MPTLRRDGVELWYDDSGTGGPPLLLVHGFGGDHTHMAPLFEHFRQTRRVVTVDRRGHGRSDKPEQDYTIGGFADDLAWLVDELGLDRPVVVVHSMEAIGLDLAARYPTLPTALVLLDGPTFPPPEVEAALGDLVEGLRTPGYRDVLAQAVPAIAFRPGDDSPLVSKIVHQMVSVPQHVIVSTLAEYLAYDKASAAAACTVPVLYVAGMFPCDLDRFRQLTPQLVTERVVGTGHFIMLEAPDQVVTMIERFLDRVPA